MKELKSGVTLRGDCAYCPLSLQIDSYWNCLTNCHHCYLRGLNHTWGTDLRPVDLVALERRLTNGLRNASPKSPLAWALASKKTIRFGNKTDPYQAADIEWQRSRGVVGILRNLDWSYVIQTRFTANIFRDLDLIIGHPGAGIMPVVSPGLERDWEILERSLTTPPRDRIIHAAHFQRDGLNVGINGEPFIPGFHTVQDFRDTLLLLKGYGIQSYNTYHLHLNPHNAKEMAAIGLDIERIWYMNQDAQWRPILRQLIDISKEIGIRLGCPDFVNSGSYQEDSNTCCGLNVPNPCTFNAIQWKKLQASGVEDPEEIARQSWDGVGDWNDGLSMIRGEAKGMYTLNDITKEETHGFFDFGI